MTKKKPGKGTAKGADQRSAPPQNPAATAAPHPAPSATRAALAFDPAPFPAEVLRLALGFALIACPKEGPDARIVFDLDRDVPVVASHDRYRCHMAFLPRGATRAYGCASRANAKKLHKLLGGLDETDEAEVTVSASGRVEIRRRGGQPTLVHNIDLEGAPLDWRPPTDAGAGSTVAPLALASDQLQRAVRYPGASVQIEHRTSARAIVNVTSGGEVVARAVLAERGLDLYPPPAPRQASLFDAAPSPAAAARYQVGGPVEPAPVSIATEEGGA